MSDKKEFEVGGKKYNVVTPSPKVIQEASVTYSVELANCLKRGVQSKSQVLKFLSENGVWDSKKDKEESDIRKELDDLEVKICRGGRQSLKTGRENALKMRDLRRRLTTLISERQSYESNSAESLADNARFDFLVASCTFNENGTRVYQSYQSYVDNAQDDIAYAAASNLASIMYGLDEDYNKKLTENVFLSKYNLVDDQLRLIDKEGNLVDREYRKINDKGHYINEKGERIDINGNRLDEDGSYLIETEFYDEEEEVVAKEEDTPSD